MILFVVGNCVFAIAASAVTEIQGLQDLKPIESQVARFGKVHNTVVRDGRRLLGGGCQHPFPNAGFGKFTSAVVGRKSGGCKSRFDRPHGRNRDAACHCPRRFRATSAIGTSAWH